ncbi:hypothetical protein H9Q13_09310 [Pontibacter sp. JH31]|uniref:Uncharacterized protein n=1 Tax=Pontibacter aquaedesilientis TaxID=2766980 RepID=A0ABR7XIX7_9BACT|nr:hypothetical protein [Pontibacter aquaedesilientis]MBD1397361.1 hypothetical protein [Pontibacter aquaedesilientis]
MAAFLSAFLLVGLVSTPCAAVLHNGSDTSQAAVEQTKETSAIASPKNTTAQPAPQKKQKSILDAEALESPFSFFKDMSSSEEEESEMSAKSGAIVLALKVLAATLLSTIM